MESPRFAVIIPMYNEESSAQACVRAFCTAIEKNAYPARLIVVDDGSADRTAEILRHSQEDFRQLTVFFHEHNLGYGRALCTGIAKAAEEGFDYVLFADSDLTNDPKYLKSFFEEMKKGPDIIKATRYAGGTAGVRGVPLYKRIISSIGNRLAALLYGIPLSDCTNGFRALKVNHIKNLPYTERGFAIIMEELYLLRKKTNLRFAEVPYVLSARADTQGDSSHSYGPGMCWQYLKYPLKSFIRRGFR